MPATTHVRRLRTAYFVTASAFALALPAVAGAQSAPDMVDNQPHIVVNDALNPNGPAPGGALDEGVNGIGQMITLVQNPPPATAPPGTPPSVGLSLCSGSLINPRTVIFAAHCVNTRPAAAYGSETGISGGITVAGLPPSTGTPISFGFSATNRCQGVAVNGCATGTGPYERWRDSGYRSQTGSNIFNVNQVWYDTRSLEPNAVGFLYADIAIATLDTPASDIPTWAMLFSPLDGPTHGAVTGYGVSGSHSSASGAAPCTAGTPPGDVCRPLGGIDYRRRVAENMIDALLSLDDRDNFLFGPGNVDNPQALYQTDFDSPSGPQPVPLPSPPFPPGSQTVTFPNYDFDLFNGAALPREATTAGGDSGGPLIADQAYDRSVVVGVLSGGTRFFNGQRFSTYGSNSFYQPLFLYWEEIVANNPYVYATNRAGIREWTNPNHWVQEMDPNYQIAVNGELQNGTPNFRSDGPAGNGPRFGTVCFLDDCADLTAPGTPLQTSDTPIIVPGGPGSTNFVPNNVAPVNSATPGATVKARYYDVTLSAIGATRLSNASITIDKLTIDGATLLNVRSSGSLQVLGDFTQLVGATHVDGLLKSGETFFLTGLLSGSGRLDPTFLTSAAAVIAPGDLFGTGTLTIQGDVALASATTLVLDVNRNAQDKLVIVGDAQNPGQIALGGTVFFQKNGAAPRHGQTFDIVTATGGVVGTFDNVAAFQGIGVLRPSLTYTANAVSVNIRAGSVKDYIGSNAGPFALAFANALDALRGGSYNDLSGLYGAIDVMGVSQMTATLNGLAPRVAGLAQIETAQQKNMVLGMVGDRLSMIGTNRAPAGTLSVMGAPETLGLAIGQTSISGSSASQLSFARSLTSTRTMGTLPENVSGFISGGYEAGRPGEAGIATGGERSTWHIAMGLEMEAASNLTLGTAFGYVNGRSNVIGTEAETRTSQAIAYGSYRLSKQAYVAGLASVTHTDVGVQRGVTDGLGKFNLNGDTTAMSYDLQLETGVNFGIAKGLTFTPRAALRYSSTTLDGYREQGGEVALLVDDLSERRLEARMGAQISGGTKIGGWALTPHLAADRVQALSTAGSEFTVRFAEAAGFAFALPGFSTDRAWTEVKGGLNVSKGPLSFGASVQSSLGRDDYRDDRAVADFTFRF